jgi:hypothetical protein
MWSGMGSDGPPYLPWMELRSCRLSFRFTQLPSLEGSQHKLPLLHCHPYRSDTDKPDLTPSHMIPEFMGSNIYMIFRADWDLKSPTTIAKVPIIPGSSVEMFSPLFPLAPCEQGCSRCIPYKSFDSTYSLTVSMGL